MPSNPTLADDYSSYCLPFVVKVDSYPCSLVNKTITILNRSSDSLCPCTTHTPSSTVSPGNNCALAWWLARTSRATQAVAKHARRRLSMPWLVGGVVKAVIFRGRRRMQPIEYPPRTAKFGCHLQAYRRCACCLVSARCEATSLVHLCAAGSVGHPLVVGAHEQQDDVHLL